MAIVTIVMLLWLLRRVELKAARERQLADEQRRDAAVAEQNKDERIRYRFKTTEKTERYLNRELKNRILVWGLSCAAQSMHGQIEELTEVLNNKAVLMRLSTGWYEPSWDTVEPTALIDRRWERFVAANSPFERAPTTGAAAGRTTLRLDKVLFDICLDNMLSNAFKYGDASKPPALSLRIDPLDDGATRVRLSLELRNWAGPEHAALLQMGEKKLNEIAHAEGRRAHEHADEVSSGHCFPMAAAAAKALGGTVHLELLNDGVVAKLELPDVAAVLSAARDDATVTTTPVKLELSWLKIALADDFAPVHFTKTGAGVCRECRQLDAEEGNVPRLIFIVSANDSPEDAERFRAAGADGSLGKRLSTKKLRQLLEDVVQTHPRFAPAGTPRRTSWWRRTRGGACRPKRIP